MGRRFESCRAHQVILSAVAFVVSPFSDARWPRAREHTMPCSYAIHKDRRLVITKIWDRLAFPELRAHQEEFRNDPDFDPEYNLLIDATGATALDISVDQARTIASQGLFAPTSRRAFLVSNPALFGMARLIGVYHGMATKQEQVVRVFYDRALAFEWLGVKDDPEEKR